MATKVKTDMDFSHMDNRMGVASSIPDSSMLVESRTPNRFEEDTPPRKKLNSKRVEFTDDMMMQLYEDGLRDAGKDTGKPPRKAKRGTSELLESQDTGSDLSEDILMELLESVERLNKRFSRIEKYLFDE